MSQAGWGLRVLQRFPRVCCAINSEDAGMRIKRLWRAVFGAVFLALWTTTLVSAQMLSSGYGLVGAPMSNFLSSSYLT
jgi:hypothetical protein